MTESSTGEDTGSAASRYSGALWSYGTGLALLGGAVGYYVGSSESPVVAAALPLLFGLVSGAGGLYLAKVDLSKSVNRMRLTAIGVMLSAFVVCLLFGTVVGISLRTGIGLSIFFTDLWHGSQPKSSAVLDTSNLSTTDALRLALLRSSLKSLGASPEEQAAILLTARAGVATGEDQKQIADTLNKVLVLLNNVDGLITADTATRQSSDGEEDQESDDAAHTLSSAINKVRRDIKRYDNYVKEKEKPPIPAQYLADQFRGFDSDIDPSNLSVDEWLSSRPEISNALSELQFFLIDSEVRLARTNVDVGEDVLQSVIDFLQAESGGVETPDSDAEPSYRRRAIKP